MSTLGFCENCGGHGVTFKTVTTDVPGLTTVQRKRVAQGRPAVLAVPCTVCDGEDQATPHAEGMAEMGES